MIEPQPTKNLNPDPQINPTKTRRFKPATLGGKNKTPLDVNYSQQVNMSTMNPGPVTVEPRPNQNRTYNHTHLNPHPQAIEPSSNNR